MRAGAYAGAPQSDKKRGISSKTAVLIPFRHETSGTIFWVAFFSKIQNAPESRKGGSAKSRKRGTRRRGTFCAAKENRSPLYGKGQKQGVKEKAEKQGTKKKAWRTARKRGAKRLRREGRAEEIKKRPPVVSGRRSLYAFSVPDSDGFPIAKGRGARPKPPVYPGETGAYFLSRLRLCPPLQSFRRGGQRNRGIGQITGPGGRKYFRRGLSRGVLLRQIRHRNGAFRPWEGRRSRSSHRGFRPAAVCGRGRGNVR